MDRKMLNTECKYNAFRRKLYLAKRGISPSAFVQPSKKLLKRLEKTRVKLVAKEAEEEAEVLTAQLENLAKVTLG